MRPRTAEPSVAIATVFRLIVSRRASAGVLGDRGAHPGDPGGIGPGQVLAVAPRHLRGDLDLAAEVQEERTVGDLEHREAVECPDRGDLSGVRHVDRVAGQVDHQPAVRGLRYVQRGQGSARRGDDARQVRGGVAGRPCLDPHGDRIAGTGDSSHGRLL